MLVEMKFGFVFDWMCNNLLYKREGCNMDNGDESYVYGD